MTQMRHTRIDPDEKGAVGSYIDALLNAQWLSQRDQFEVRTSLFQKRSYSGLFFLARILKLFDRLAIELHGNVFVLVVRDPAPLSWKVWRAPDIIRV
jgi:hypothetical protein